MRKLLTLAIALCMCSMCFGYLAKSLMSTKTTRLDDNIDLPYDAELEYLEGDGSACINLPIMCGSDLDFELGVSKLDSNTYFFGAYHNWGQSNPPSRYTCYLYLNYSNYRFDVSIGWKTTNKNLYET